MKKVQDKVALVTGGASGLGKAIAQGLISEGAKVVITDIQVELGLSTAETFGCDFLQQDVTDERQWNQIMAQVEEKHGALHILVNNAGIVGPQDAKNPENTRFEDWKKIQSINVDGVFLGCRAAIPVIRRAGGGSIINISSVAALTATAYATAYGLSKAAVRHLTKSVAQHCAETDSNIRCNSIHPGDVLTPMIEKVQEEIAEQHGVSKERVMEHGKSVYPLGEYVTPLEIANAVLYLVSEEARNINGTKLVVDGGYVSCMKAAPLGK
jgi:3(or 17)beta-hydroxysteroid dehydrogenase